MPKKLLKPYKNAASSETTKWLFVCHVGRKQEGETRGRASTSKDRRDLPLAQSRAREEVYGMWVVGYGSLMGGGWEKEFACLRHCVAVLTSYRRTFNNASLTSRGTKESPCTTLNL